MGLAWSRQSGPCFNRRHAEADPMVAMPMRAGHRGVARMAIALVVVRRKHSLMGRAGRDHHILLAEEGVEGRTGQQGRQQADGHETAKLAPPCFKARHRRFYSWAVGRRECVTKSRS